MQRRLSLYIFHAKMEAPLRKFAHMSYDIWKKGEKKAIKTSNILCSGLRFCWLIRIYLMVKLLSKNKLVCENAVIWAQEIFFLRSWMDSVWFFWHWSLLLEYNMNITHFHSKRTIQTNTDAKDQIQPQHTYKGVFLCLATTCVYKQTKK